MPTIDISVIIPVRNGMPFLEPCLQSINQNTGVSFEVIIIDDHSTDDTRNYLHLFCKANKHFFWYKNEGKGILDALQTGLKKAKGEAITRMDADDLMTTDKLHTLWTALRQNPDGIAVGQVSYFAETELGEGYRKYANWLNKLIENGNPYTDIYKECVIPSPNWMLHRATLDKVGGFGKQYPEDYDLAFRLFQHRIPVIPVHQITHYWRDHTERTSRSDPHYADNHFIPLKVDYFIRCSLNPTFKLALYGAGKKGKKIARALQKRMIPFSWLTDNPKKIGHTIYNIELQEGLNKNLESFQVITAIAQPIEKQKIKKHILNQISKDQLFCFF